MLSPSVSSSFLHLGFKRFLSSIASPPSLSVSLSHTHTHIYTPHHTHTHTQSCVVSLRVGYQVLHPHEKWEFSKVCCYNPWLFVMAGGEKNVLYCNISHSCTKSKLRQKLNVCVIMLGRRSENYKSSAREAQSYKNSSAHHFVPKKMVH